MSQADSLMDAARNLEKADGTLNHDARQAVRFDIERLETYFATEELPAAHAASLVIYASQGAGLFETIALSRPAVSAVYLSRSPYLEPLVTEPVPRRWCAAIVSERDLRIVSGASTAALADSHSSAEIRGHRQSDGNDEHSRAEDIHDHLLAVSRQLAEEFRAGGFEVLAIGGPIAARSELEKLLPNDLRSVVITGHLELDPSAATRTDIADAMVAAIAEDHAARRADTLARFVDELQAARGDGEQARAVAGIAEVLEALLERRVETLLLTADFHAAGTRCPQCGRLYRFDVSSCPIDGTATAPVDDLREPMIAAAVRQDATVLVFDDPGPTLAAPERRVGALLRF
jgi:peptide chain release factor subunit 1